MSTRRIDGLYRTWEPDPALVDRIAVDLLIRQAREISTIRAAADLVEDYPELRNYALDDQMLDDLRDAIYQACARAVVTIPGGSDMAGPFPPEGRLIHVAHGSQWDAVRTILDELGVKLFEIPPGPSVPDFSNVPTCGLMFKESDD